MKIAHLVSTFKPYHGGMGNVAYEMAKYLAAKGHEVTVFTPAYNTSVPASEEMDGFTVRRLKPTMVYGNAAYLRNLVELESHDVIHLHHPFLGAHRVLKLKKPLIATYHMDLVGTGLKKLIFNVHEKWFLPRLFNKACKVIYNSQDYFDFSKSKRYASRPVVFLPFGVDESFKPGAPIANQTKNILFVGGLDNAHYFKGLHNLICSVKQLDRDDVVLQIVGSGELEPKYQRLVACLKLNNVKFLGKLSVQQLLETYQQSSFLVLPSIDSTEAFGLVLLEAMACGKPVIASDLPGVRSVIQPEGELGLLCKPGCQTDLTQKLNLLLASDLAKLGQKARERVLNQYSWPKIIEKIESIYKDAVKQ